jgi:IS30 family transposase
MKRGKYKKWTNEEELVIISMRADGKTSIEIAKKLNRTPDSVRGRVKKLINECKIELKQTKSSPLDYDKIGEYVSKSPGNISKAFRKYANDYGCSVNSVHGAYYCRTNKSKQRVKDRGNFFTVVGKNGHTTGNSKNTTNVKRSNLWTKVKDWLLQSLLS